MKKLFLPLLLVLLTSCTAPQVELKEITNESIVKELPIITIAEENTSPYYNFTEGETKEILERSITVLKIYPEPEIDILVDNAQTTIKETKNEEIIKDLKISINQIYNENAQTKSLTLKIEPLELGENEYIIRKSEKNTVNNKDIILEESRSDKTITITVYDEGTIVGDTDKIKRGETKTIYGITITNLKNYYKSTQYAWVIIK